MLPNYIKKSKAILLFPGIYEGSLIFGAKGGNGLLLIRKNDSWSGPFFYSIGGLSVGLQFGVKSGKVIMTIMSLRGLKSILGERVKFGVDIDAAVMNEGIGYSAESTLRLADIFSFSDNKGLFLGGSFEGTYLQPRNDLNFSLYNQKYSKEEVLEESSFNKVALKIIQTLKNINSEAK
jgi:SH3 domain-containing YSC84-like protein 1